MATYIDESVVKLSVDEADFNKNSDKVIKKLDELKKSLKFEGAVEGFEEIEKAAKKVDFSPMEKGVEAVSVKFNALYTIADAFVRNKINDIVDSTERMIKGLTIDNVSAGWSKYAEKTAAVQTIMAATAKDFSDTGEQMEYVEKQLGKLSWFTDETSYSFLDMVNNIGKFTSNNIPLEQSVTAMQGISTWAAISGANVGEAGRAMYNLSQAIAVGAVKLMDWKSIENANMATSQFKETAIQTAEELGTLRKVGEGLWETLGGKSVSVSNFNENLSEGWFSSDVLLKALDKYGGFTNVLYEFTQAADGIAATTALNFLEDYQNGTLDMAAAIDETGLSAEKLTFWLDKLADSELELGNKAFRAAQEAKTFQEAIDATAEAVSSGWMETFEIIFGNYEEAKELWSELAEGLYEVFVESANMRNGLLRDWKALDGRTYLIDGIRSLLSKLAGAADFVKETFQEVFPPKTAEQLVSMTIGFRDLIDALTPSEMVVNAFHNALLALFKTIQKIGQVAVVIFAGLEPIWELLFQIGGAIIGLIGDLSALFGFGLDNIFSVDNLTSFYYILYSISSIVADIVRSGFFGLLGLLYKIAQFGQEIWATFKNGEGGIKGFVDAVVINFQRLISGFNLPAFFESFDIRGLFESIIGHVQNLYNKIRSGDSIVSNVLRSIFEVAKTVLGGLVLLIKTVFDAIKDGLSGMDFDGSPVIDFFKSIGEAISNSNIVANIGGAAQTILNFVSEMFGFVADMDSLSQQLKWVVDSIVGQLKIIYEWFVEELTKLGLRDVADVLLIVAIAALIDGCKKFVVSLKAVSSAASTALTSVSEFFSVLAGAHVSSATANLAAINNIAKNTKYLQIGVAVAMIANSIAQLGAIPVEDLGRATSALITVFGVLTIFDKAVGAGVIKKGKKKYETASTQILKLAASVALVTTAVSVLAKALSMGFKETVDIFDASGNKVGQKTEYTVEAMGYQTLALIEAIAAIGVIMAEMAGLVALINVIKPGPEFKNASAGIIAMATAILELSIAVAFLSSLNVGASMVAVIEICLMMVAFGAAAALMGDVKVSSIVSATASMTLMTFAIIEMLVPLTILSALMMTEGNQIIEALKILLLIMAALAGVTMLVGNFAGSAATLLTAGTMMTSFALSITIMAGAILLLNKADPEAFANGITLIALAFIGFSVVAGIAQMASVGLIALSVAMLSIGGTVLIFAATINILVEAATKFSIIALAFTYAAEDLGEEFPKKVQAAMGNIRIVLQSFLSMLVGISADIAKAIVVLVVAIKNAFLLAFPDILSGLMIVATEICEAIVKFGPSLVDAAIRMIRSLTPYIPEFADACADFFYEIAAAIGPILHETIMGLLKSVFTTIFGEPVVDAVIGFFGGFGKSSGDAYVDAVDRAIATEENRKRLQEDAKQTGVYIDEGMNSGLEAFTKDIYDTGVRVGETAIEGINDGADTHSASRATTQTGEDVDQGLVNGMENRRNEVYEAGRQSGAAVVDGVAEGAGLVEEAGGGRGLEGLANAMNDGFLGPLRAAFGDFKQTGFEQFTSYFSGAIEGATEGGKAVGGIMDGILTLAGVKSAEIEKKVTSPYVGVLNSMQLGAKMVKETVQSKSMKDSVADLGTSISSDFGKVGKSASKSGSTAAEKVKTAAEKIIESYKDALDELDYLDKKHKGEYNLWSALNDQARDVEKTAANLEYVNKQIETQTKRTQIAEEKYQKIAKAMGEASEEARDAEIEWIEQQVILAELQNEMVELQNKTIEEAAKQLELEEKNAELTYNLWVSSNKNASQVEQLEKKLEYTLKKLEYSSNKVTEATEAYNKALEDYGEEAIETRTALNELLEIEKDYADLSAEVEEIQKSIADLENQHAESVLENSRLAYDIWEMNNKSASKAEKAARQTSLLMIEYESILKELNKTTNEYHATLAKYGEDSIEAANAYKAMLEADKKRLEKYAELAQQEKEELTWLTESLSLGLQKAEAEDELWDSLNENATKEEKNARERLSIIRKRVYAEQELFIMEKQYAQLVEEEGANSDNALQAAIEITKKKAEIAGYVTDEKNKTEELLDIESKNLDFERKRLQVADEYWSVINENATEVEKTSHEIEKANWEMVLSMKELTLLSEQYNKQVERYGETSDEARSAWESYRDKQKEIVELQNERKALELELIENELSLQSLADTRAKTEYDLWEALNQDADETEKKTKKITYQMSLLESATEKLRVASKKYNYALAAYGEDAKKTQELFNEMLDAQLEYANTYNELKSIQQEIITKNNDILEQLDQSEKLLSYGYNMWESLYDDISDAQKIEAEIKKLGMDLTTQVARANYYGAEWKRAVAKYGENSAEAQSAYLDYLDALNEAVKMQSSLEKKEAELTKKRADDAQALQDAWDEVRAKDLVGGTSIYDELVEMGLSDAEIEAYVKEKAGVIEDSIDAEMDFSLDKMQSKAEESLREWGMTWMDGVYEVADDVVTTAGSCIDEMTSIIDQGAVEGKEHAETAMSDIDGVVTTGGQTIVTSTEQAMNDMIRTITTNKSEVVDSVKQVIDDVATTASAGTTRQFVTIGLAIPLGIEQGIYSGRSNVIQAAINVIEDAIWAARRAGEIHSPSRPMIWIGTMLDAGVIKGIEQRAGEIAKTMASAIQNGINVMRNVVHTSNTLDFVGQMVAGGIQSAVDGYSYNILEVGREVLDSLASEYDEMVDDVIGDNQWLIDALRDYGFDETTHGIEFVVNLDADEARTELENLLLGREDALEYYDELLSMQERNAEKDQSDLAVRAEAQAIAREINRILASIQASEDAITAIVEAGKSKSYDDAIAGKKLEYVQNIYSTKPLSALDIYRNTNSQLLRFTNWR